MIESVMDFWERFSDKDFRGLVSVINASPDSFYTKSTVASGNNDALIRQVEEIVEAGACWIDIGGESSKPGSIYVDAEEELRRLIPVLKVVRKRTQLPISIDTRKETVIRPCVEEGADILNDISALRDDPLILPYLARNKIPIVLMHMQGNPQSMQISPHYDDCVNDVVLFLHERVQLCRKYGIDKIIVDPGIGFGKSYNDNVQLLRSLDTLKQLSCPILVGASRKKFLGAIIKDSRGIQRLAEDRLSSSLSVTQFAFTQGANFVRVHDIKENSEVLKTLNVLEGRERINV